MSTFRISESGNDGNQEGKLCGPEKKIFVDPKSLSLLHFPTEPICCLFTVYQILPNLSHISKSMEKQEGLSGENSFMFGFRQTLEPLIALSLSC